MSKNNKKKKKIPSPVVRPRYYALDAARGLAVILMILHHFAYDLLMYNLIPEKLLYNGVVNALHIIFASVFMYNMRL